VQRPAARVVLASSSAGVQVSPRPDARPDNIERRNNVVRAGFLGRVFGPGDRAYARARSAATTISSASAMQRIPGRLAGLRRGAAGAGDRSIAGVR
jgi:hypothetical protein